jgi:hypothetical protein
LYGAIASLTNKAHRPGRVTPLTREFRLLSSGLLAGFALLAVAACGGGGAGASGSLAPAPTPSPTPAPAPTPAPSSAVETPRGYYALTSRRLSAAEKAELVGNPAISGMTSYVTWADIEPVRDQMDFSRLDSDIAIARAAGEKITIGVFTGRDGLPDWLGAAGVRLWTTSQGTTLVHPGDAAFVALWSQRVAMLGQRYDADPTVVQVTICGAAGTLCGPRYPELPSDLSYDQLVANWRQVIDAYVAAFPTTALNLEVQLTTGFGTQLPLDLYASVPASVTIGPFAEFLSDTNPDPASPLGLAFAQVVQGRAFCSFQTVSPLGDRLDEAVALGRSYGCRYFELYADDVRSQAAGLPML